MTHRYRRRSLWLGLIALAALMGAPRDGWAAFTGGCGGGGAVVPMVVISGQFVFHNTWQVAGYVTYHSSGAITIDQPRVTVTDEWGTEIWSYDQTGWITVATAEAAELLLAGYATVMMCQSFPRSRFGSEVTEVTWTSG